MYPAGGGGISSNVRGATNLPPGDPVFSESALEPQAINGAAATSRTSEWSGWGIGTSSWLIRQRNPRI